MCQARNETAIKIGRKTVWLDTCLVPLIRGMNTDYGLKTVASCCGHGIYNATIFYEHGGQYMDYYSGIIVIPDKRKQLNFYVKNRQGYYFNIVLESIKRNEVGTLVDFHRGANKIPHSKHHYGACHCDRCEAVRKEYGG